jgi:cytochrome c554/c'-like protein
MTLVVNRKTGARALLLAALATFGFLGLRLAEAAGSASGEHGAARTTADNKYIGADKCKSCHGAADSGDQHGTWKGTQHAKAFERLSSEEAKKLGAEKGVADPSKADACVSCHVTAFGVPEEQIKKGFDRAQGIQCEACHGPGEQHMKARFAAAAKGDAAQGYVQVPADEIIAVPKQDTCVKCHNEKSPSYKPFCFHEFEAKVRHLNPKKPRGDLELGPCSCPKCEKGCPDSCKELAKTKK